MGSRGVSTAFSGKASIREFREELSRDQAPYQLAVSVGYDELTGEQESIQNCIEQADHQLYLDKKHQAQTSV